MSRFAPIAKALTGAIIAALAAAGTALVGDQHIDAGEGVAVAIAFFTALYGVWQIPNKPPQE